MEENSSSPENLLKPPDKRPMAAPKVLSVKSDKPTNSEENSSEPEAPVSEVSTRHHVLSIAPVRHRSNASDRSASFETAGELHGELSLANSCDDSREGSPIIVNSEVASPAGGWMIEKPGGLDLFGKVQQLEEALQKKTLENIALTEEIKLLQIEHHFSTGQDANEERFQKLMNELADRDKRIVELQKMELEATDKYSQLQSQMKVLEKELAVLNVQCPLDKSNEEIMALKKKVEQLQEINAQSMSAAHTLFLVCEKVGIKGDADCAAVVDRIESLLEEIFSARDNEKKESDLHSKVEALQFALGTKDVELEEALHELKQQKEEELLQAVKAAVESTQKQCEATFTEAFQVQENIFLSRSLANKTDAEKLFSERLGMQQQEMEAVLGKTVEKKEAELLESWQLLLQSKETEFLENTARQDAESTLQLRLARETWQKETDEAVEQAIRQKQLEAAAQTDINIQAVLCEKEQEKLTALDLQHASFEEMQKKMAEQMDEHVAELKSKLLEEVLCKRNEIRENVLMTMEENYHHVGELLRKATSQKDSELTVMQEQLAAQHQLEMDAILVQERNKFALLQETWSKGMQEERESLRVQWEAELVEKLQANKEQQANEFKELFQKDKADEINKLQKKWARDKERELADLYALWQTQKTEEVSRLRNEWQQQKDKQVMELQSRLNVFEELALRDVHSAEEIDIFESFEDSQECQALAEERFISKESKLHLPSSALKSNDDVLLKEDSSQTASQEACCARSNCGSGLVSRNNSFHFESRDLASTRSVALDPLLRRNSSAPGRSMSASFLRNESLQDNELSEEEMCMEFVICIPQMANEKFDDLQQRVEEALAMKAKKGSELKERAEEYLSVIKKLRGCLQTAEGRRQQFIDVATAVEKEIVERSLRLVRHCKRLKQANSDMESELASLQNSLADEVSGRKTVETELAITAKSLETSAQRNEQTDAELAELRDKLQDIMAQLGRSEQRAEQALGDFRAAQESITLLKNEHEKNVSNIHERLNEAHAKEIGQLQQSLLKSEEKLEKKEEAIQQLSSTKEELQSRISELRDETARIESDKRQAEASLVHKEELIASLHNDVRLSRQLLEDKSRELTLVMENFNDTQRSCNSREELLSQGRKALEEKIARLEGVISQLTDDNSNLRIELSAIRIDLKESQLELTSLTERYKTLQEESQQHRTHFEEDRQSLLSQLQTLNEQCQKHQDVVDTNNQKAQKELNTMIGRYDQLQEDTRHHQAIFEDERRTMKAEIQALTLQCQVLHENMEADSRKAELQLAELNERDLMLLEDFEQHELLFEEESRVLNSEIYSLKEQCQEENNKLGLSTEEARQILVLHLEKYEQLHHDFARHRQLVEEERLAFNTRIHQLCEQCQKADEEFRLLTERYHQLQQDFESHRQLAEAERQDQNSQICALEEQAKVYQTTIESNAQQAQEEITGLTEMSNKLQADFHQQRQALLMEIDSLNKQCQEHLAKMKADTNEAERSLDHKEKLISSLQDDLRVSRQLLEDKSREVTLMMENFNESQRSSRSREEELYQGRRSAEEKVVRLEALTKLLSEDKAHLESELESVNTLLKEGNVQLAILVEKHKKLQEDSNQKQDDLLERVNHLTEQYQDSQAQLKMSTGEAQKALAAMAERYDSLEDEYLKHQQQCQEEKKNLEAKELEAQQMLALTTERYEKLQQDKQQQQMLVKDERQRMETHIASLLAQCQNSQDELEASAAMTRDAQHNLALTTERYEKLQQDTQQRQRLFKGERQRSETQIATLLEQCQKCQAELKASAEQARQKIDSLTIENGQLQADFQQEQQRSSEEIRLLRTQLQELSATLENNTQQAEQEFDMLAQRYAKQADDFKQERQTLQTQLQALNEQCQEYKTKLHTSASETQRELAEMSSKYNDLQGDSQQQHSLFEKERQDMISQIRTLNEQYQLSKSELESSTKNCIQLQEDFKQEKQDLAQEIKIRDASLKKMEGDFQALSEKYKELQEEFQKHQLHYEEERESLNCQISSLTNQCEEHLIKIQFSAQEIKVYQGQICSLEAELETQQLNLYSEIRKDTDGPDDFKAKQEQITIAKKYHQLQADTRQNQLLVEEEKQTLQAKILSLERQCREHQAKLEGITQVEECESKIASLEQELERNRMAFISKQEEADDSKQFLEDAMHQLDESKKSYAELAKTVDGLRKDCAEANLRVEVLQSKNEQMKREGYSGNRPSQVEERSLLSTSYSTEQSKGFEKLEHALAAEQFKVRELAKDLNGAKTLNQDLSVQMENLVSKFQREAKFRLEEYYDLQDRHQQLNQAHKDSLMRRAELTQTLTEFQNSKSSLERLLREEKSKLNSLLQVVGRLEKERDAAVGALFSVSEEAGAIKYEIPIFDREDYNGVMDKMRALLSRVQQYSRQMSAKVSEISKADIPFRSSAEDLAQLSRLNSQSERFSQSFHKPSKVEEFSEGIKALDSKDAIGMQFSNTLPQKHKGGLGWQALAREVEQQQEQTRFHEVAKTTMVTTHHYYGSSSLDARLQNMEISNRTQLDERGRYEPHETQLRRMQSLKQVLAAEQNNSSEYHMMSTTQTQIEGASGAIASRVKNLLRNVGEDY